MPQRLRPLTGLDAAFLYLEAAGPPMHVGSVMLLQVSKARRARFHADLVEHVRGRLGRAAPLRRVLVEAPLELAHPAWRQLARIDLERQILRTRLPAPGTPAQLWRAIADLHAQALPRDRPLWQFVVIEGLRSRELAFYSKLHHALLDGEGVVALAQLLLDAQGAATVARAAPRRRAAAPVSFAARVGQLAGLVRHWPQTLKLAADAIRDAGGLLGSLRDAVALAPRTPFNAQVGPRRSYAVASLPFEHVRRIAHHFDVKVNDVILTLCASALRDWLRRRGALPRASLIAAMPISLRVPGNAEINNQVTMLQCTLRTDLADPVERLHAIHAATLRLKTRVGAFRSLIPVDFPGFAAPIWATGLSRLWAGGRLAERLPPLANLVISNIPGPSLPLFIAGARIAHYYPVSIVTHGLGLNITVGSYAGSLEFGVIACKEIVEKPATIASGLAKALRALDAARRSTPRSGKARARVSGAPGARRRRSSAAAR